jgi:hypothetical protein
MKHRDLIIAVMLVILTLAGCAGPDYTQAQKGEAPLATLYEAMGEPYPLTEPVFIGCNYFRRVGEKQHRGLGGVPGELLSFAKDPTDTAALTGVFKWSMRYCKQSGN